MTEIFGTSTFDRLFNAAISRGYSPEAAAAIGATISLENAGADLITFKGERQKRYLKYYFTEELDSWHAPITRNTTHIVANGDILVK